MLGKTDEDRAWETVIESLRLEREERDKLASPVSIVQQSHTHTRKTKRS